MSRKKGPYAYRRRRRCARPLTARMNPPHSARFRSNGPARGEMLRRGQRDRHRRGPRLLPPIEFLDATDAGRSHERSVPERRHHQRIESIREHAERPQIAVIVMVVAEQHDRDRRQVVEQHGRLPNAPRSSTFNGPARSEYIGSVRMFPAAV